MSVICINPQEVMVNSIEYLRDLCFISLGKLEFLVLNLIQLIHISCTTIDEMIVNAVVELYITSFIFT